VPTSKENYLTEDEIRDIKVLGKKPNYEFRKRCSWTKPINCSKRSNIPCQNVDCYKIACMDHSTRNGLIVT
jgi:hypothetical protein